MMCRRTSRWQRGSHAIIEPGGSVLFQRKGFTGDDEPDLLALWPDIERVIFQVDGVRRVPTSLRRMAPSVAVADMPVPGAQGDAESSSA